MYSMSQEQQDGLLKVIFDILVGTISIVWLVKLHKYNFRKIFLKRFLRNVSCLEEKSNRKSYFVLFMVVKNVMLVKKGYGSLPFGEFPEKQICGIVKQPARTTKEIRLAVSQDHHGKYLLCLGRLLVVKMMRVVELKA